MRVVSRWNEGGSDPFVFTSFLLKTIYGGGEDEWRNKDMVVEV